MAVVLLHLLGWQAQAAQDMQSILGRLSVQQVWCTLSPQQLPPRPCPQVMQSVLGHVQICVLTSGRPPLSLFPMHEFPPNAGSLGPHPAALIPSLSPSSPLRPPPSWCMALPPDEWLLYLLRVCSLIQQVLSTLRHLPALRHHLMHSFSSLCVVFVSCIQLTKFRSSLTR